MEDTGKQVTAAPGVGLGNRDSASEPLCRLGISRSDHGPGVGTALLGNVKFESHWQYSEFRLSGRPGQGGSGSPVERSRAGASESLLF